MKRFIFVPRTKAFIDDMEEKKLEVKIHLSEMVEKWGPNYQVLLLDDQGEFKLTAGDQLYVMGGHGKPACGEVYWGRDNKDILLNPLSAETVAKYTVERFPKCYRAQTGTAKPTFLESQGIKPPDTDKLPKGYKIKPTSKNPTPGVLIKVYSCHSGEGGFNSFASQFARAFAKAFLPTGDTFEVTFFGYRGTISPSPTVLSTGNVQDAKRKDKDIKESVNATDKHRWTKIIPFAVHSRASEARDDVAWLKSEKGGPWQRRGV